MKLLFLGLLFCDDSLEEANKLSKSGVQMAPHLFQYRLIKGLNSLDVVNLKVINVPPIGSFPFNYNKFILKDYYWEHNKQLGYLNLPLIKKFIITKKIVSEIEDWVRDNCAGDEKLYILMYSLYQPFLKAVTFIKKKYGDIIKISLIQTDAIPGRNGMIKTKRAKRMGDKLIAESKICDSFIGLSRYLYQPLEVNDKRFGVIECICDSNQTKNIVKKKSDNIFLYSGTTSKEYGICDLVDAFIGMDDAQLWICGCGNSDDYIKVISEEHSNIRFFGFVSQEMLFDLRDKCDFLINPRRPSGTYTMYSFPSKTAEYLCSGKPVVMYKLEGIPDEYDKYINYIHSNTAFGIKKELTNLINKDYKELLNRAEQAREFMLKEKNSKVQAEKLIKIISGAC